MCDPIAHLDRNTGDVTVICQQTGLPITISNEYGMFCARECDKALEVQIKEELEGLLESFAKSLGVF